MVIQIPDELSGRERRRLLNLTPVIYALEHCKTKNESAEFLGISSRCLRNIVNRYPELAKYKQYEKWLAKMPDEKRKGYLAMLRKYPDH